MLKHIFRVFLLSHLLLTLGCAGVGSGRTAWPPDAIGPAWPSDSPRVRFLTSFPDTPDSEEGQGRRLSRFIFGEDQTPHPLINPVGVAADGGGRVWIADPGGRIVHAFDLSRGRSSVMGQVNGVALGAPAGLALDADRDRLYLADAQLNQVFILRPDGSYVGEITPPNSFGRPAGLAIDPVGNLYVADVTQGKVFVFSPEGVFIRALGSHKTPNGLFLRPIAVAVSDQGHVAVLDAMNFRVEIFGPDWLPQGVVGGLGDSPGLFARPRGLAFDGDGNLYVADAAFDNIQIFDLEGRLLLYFGKSGDEAGQFCLPAGLYHDGANRLYAVDSCNYRVQIFEYLPIGGL
ncbi:SMP-30/gluconolactonase/LRE family protein [Geoalkalibacter subterraneus]|nr:SMP-30/gluconolactonase/LRE family protein [Geoalkalibacter subterraneus]